MTEQDVLLNEVRAAEGGDTLTVQWNNVIAALSAYQGRPLSQAERGQLVDLVLRWNDGLESPTNALRATLELIASLTDGKACSACSTANRVAREAVRKAKENT